MRRRGIIIGIICLLCIIAVLPAFLRLHAERMACLKEMAACEKELTAIAVKLRIYAEAHQGKFPETDAELTKALGTPLPARYIYMGHFMYLTPKGSQRPDLDTIVIERERHNAYPSWLEERVLPLNRIHMLLNDLTIYHARDHKAFT